MTDVWSHRLSERARILASSIGSPERQPQDRPEVILFMGQFAPV